jgi:hypothetical protein
VVIFAEWSVPTHNTISAALVEYPQYNVTLTLFIMLRVAAVIGYLARYGLDLSMEHLKYVYLAHAGWVLVVIGWALIVSYDENELREHFIGISIALLGNLLVSIGLIWTSKFSDPMMTATSNRLTILLILIFAATTTSWMFLWLFSISISYIFEHVAYLAYLLFYAVFFTVHSPNPYRPVKNKDNQFVAYQVLELPVIRVSDISRSALPRCK